MAEDNKTEALALTFCFDMFIFLMELMIFFCIRHKRDNGNVLLNWKPQNAYFREFANEDLRPTMKKEVQREQNQVELE